MAWTESWNGVAVLSKFEIVEVTKEFPGDKEDSHCGYLEVIINQILICCLYLTNGNPYPGPKFEYIMAWIKLLMKRAKALLKLEV
ncbi:hypothetical protein [Sphingobacterium sp.]|uniref:hypothetical protein n=1 Tax=Sphingobacterium sp. TaxID=341027 RepID=UPI0031DAC400